MTLAWKWIVLGTLVVFLLGLGLGVAGGETETVSETTTETRTETHTETVVEVRAPRACVVALDYAVEGFRRVSEVFTTAGNLDVERLGKQATAFETWANRNGPKIAAAVETCRTASG